MNDIAPVMAPMMLDRESHNIEQIRLAADLHIDNKRKALDDLDSQASPKRAKSSHKALPETEKRAIKVIPFPEKVGSEHQPDGTCIMTNATSTTACSD